MKMRGMLLGFLVALILCMLCGCTNQNQENELTSDLSEEGKAIYHEATVALSDETKEAYSKKELINSIVENGHDEKEVEEVVDDNFLWNSFASQAIKCVYYKYTDEGIHKKKKLKKILKEKGFDEEQVKIGVKLGVKRAKNGDEDFFYDEEINADEMNEDNEEGEDTGNGLGTEISSDEDIARDLWACTTDMVKQDYPNNTDFCKYYEAKYYNQQGDQYIVMGYMDTENEYGATERKRFTAWFTFTGEGYKDGHVEYDN